MKISPLSCSLTSLAIVLGLFCTITYANGVVKSKEAAKDIAAIPVTKNFSAIGVVTDAENTSISIDNADGTDNTTGSSSYTFDLTDVQKVEDANYAPLSLLDIQMGDEIIAQGSEKAGEIDIKRIIMLATSTSDTASTTDATTTDAVGTTTDATTTDATAGTSTDATASSTDATSTDSTSTEATSTDTSTIDVISSSTSSLSSTTPALSSDASSSTTDASTPDVITSTPTPPVIVDTPSSNDSSVTTDDSSSGDDSSAAASSGSSDSSDGDAPAPTD